MDVERVERQLGLVAEVAAMAVELGVRVWLAEDEAGRVVVGGGPLGREALACRHTAATPSRPMRLKPRRHP